MKVKKVSILGRNGFIGSALSERFKNVYNYPRKDVDFLFFFASPSSQILFNYANDWCYDETVDGFINALEFCADNNIKLIYPSSGTVYESNGSYSEAKLELEHIQKQHKYKNVLGFRIFAGYGPGEAHKGEYASVVYQFCKRMKEGLSPVIYGDGTQTRDFVYIDDILDGIIGNLDKTGVMDIGSGISTSFNEVVKTINDLLQEKITPTYIKAPQNYLIDTTCPNPISCQVSLKEGVKRILESL